MRVILCHGVRDLKKQHYQSHASDPMSRSQGSEETTLRVTCEWSYVTESKIWRNNITCHMWVILCHRVRDLMKQHYESHASDPMSRSKRSEETTLRVTCEWSYVMNIYYYAKYRLWPFSTNRIARNKQSSLISNYNAFMVFSGPLTLDSKD